MHADHGGLDVVLEGPRWPTVGGEDRRAVATRVGVDQGEACVVVADPQHGQHRAELEATGLADRHHETPVDDEVGAGVHTLAHQTDHAVAVRYRLSEAVLATVTVVLS